MSFKKIWIFEGLVWLFWGVIVFSLVASFMPDPPVRTSKSTITILRKILPQGWAFFTKDPQESFMLLYKLQCSGDSITHIKEFTYKSASLANSLGFSRKARLVGGEVGVIASSLPKSGWRDGIGPVSNIKRYSIKSQLNKDLLLVPEGTYMLVQRRPIPWAWFNRDQEKHQPFLYSVVQIKGK
jgi:antimicrobial peptide system SdpA family protein